MSEFCNHFPSSPRYTKVVLVPGPATPATVPDEDTERLCASIDSGQRSIASMAEYLILMSRLLFANRGTCSNVLNHFLGKQCCGVEGCRSVVVYRALHCDQQLMVRIHLGLIGWHDRSTIQHQPGQQD